MSHQSLNLTQISHLQVSARRHSLKQRGLALENDNDPLNLSLELVYVHVVSMKLVSCPLSPFSVRKRLLIVVILDSLCDRSIKVVLSCILPELCLLFCQLRQAVLHPDVY